MENDSIRASGSETLVDIWVEGRLRAIAIMREAIEEAGGVNSASSESARCEFVRTHLSQIVTAAKAKLREGNADLDVIAIDRIGAAKDSRKGERRKGERRKITRDTAKPAQGERRHEERRKKDRRQPTKKPA